MHIQIGTHTFRHPSDVYRELFDAIHCTPLLRSSSLNDESSCEIFWKCENFQKTGSFKIRGALHAVKSYLRQGKALSGVATHSSGNFGQALAYAARCHKIPCHVIVPENAPKAKVEAMKFQGATLEFCLPGTENREKALQKYLNQNPNTVFIHPYNDIHVMEGHTSLVVELFREGIFPEAIIVPVGGGGLISGISIAASVFFPECKILGAEPAGANDAYLSLKKGERTVIPHVETIADGLRTFLGDITFDVMRQKVSDILLVGEEEICVAQKELMSRLKIVVEPSSAVVWAALKKNIDIFRGKKVVAVLSGGNVDMN